MLGEVNLGTTKQANGNTVNNVAKGVKSVKDKHVYHFEIRYCVVGRRARGREIDEPLNSTPWFVSPIQLNHPSSNRLVRHPAASSERTART